MGLNSYSCVGSQTLVLAEGPRVPQACGPQTIYTYNGSHGLMLEKVCVSSDKRTTDSPYMQGHTALYSGSHTVWCWPKTRVLRQANHRLSVPAMGRTVLYSGSHGLVQWVTRPCTVGRTAMYSGSHGLVLARFHVFSGNSAPLGARLSALPQGATGPSSIRELTKCPSHKLMRPRVHCFAGQEGVPLVASAARKHLTTTP